MIETFGYAPPAPSETTEAELRTWLKGIDPLLDVKWQPVVYWNKRHLHWEGRYALMVNWPTADKRWSQVQSGEVDPKQANDIVGWFCEDMSDPQSMPTTLDTMETRVMNLLGQMDNTRYPWKQRMMGTIEKNKKVHATMKSEALDQVGDEADYLYRQVKGVPQVVGADFNSKGELLK